VSGEKGKIFRPGKVHPRSTNAQSKFGTARRKFVDANADFLECCITAASPELPGWRLNVAKTLVERL
jgi:hypothetical protein